jgi:hypothetical protein
MIVLPKGAFMVLRKEPETKSLIIGVEETVLNVGEITFTAPEMVDKQGLQVVFREHFSEKIKIKGVEYLYFRDYDSGIYYATTD